jgi:hypothetical protein
MHLEPKHDGRFSRIYFMPKFVKVSFIGFVHGFPLPYGAAHAQLNYWTQCRRFDNRSRRRAAIMETKASTGLAATESNPLSSATQKGEREIHRRRAGRSRRHGKAGEYVLKSRHWTHYSPGSRQSVRVRDGESEAEVNSWCEWWWRMELELQRAI